MAEEILFCKGGGCTAKLGPGILSHVLEKLPKGPQDENLLIGTILFFVETIDLVRANL